MGRDRKRRDGGGHLIYTVKEGGGSRAHSLELIVTRVLVIAHVLIVTCVLTIARVHSWALAIIHEPRWPFWLVVGCMPCGSWAIVKGARRWVVFAGPVCWTGIKTKIELNPTAKDRTTSCGCTNSEFFRLPVAMFVEKSKNRKKPV